MANISMASKAQFLTTKRARHKVLYGGRGSSKSWACADALIHLANQVPLRILCSRETQLSIKDSSKRLLDDKILSQNLSHSYKSTKTEIENIKTGSLFIFSGLRDASKIKSMEGIDICWVEEAQTVSQESIDILVPTIRKEGAEVWWTFNRKLTTDPVDKMFLSEGGPPPDSLIQQMNFYDNPWFPETLKKEMEWDRERDPDKYRHVWLGEPVLHSDAQVFNGAWSIAPVPEFKGDTGLYYGCDWGFAQDPIALVRCWIDDDTRTLYVDYEVGGVGVEVDHMPSLFDMMPLIKQHVVKCDNARPELISYMKRHGFKCVAAVKGKGSIEDGISRLKGYKIVVDPRCKRIINELILYSYKKDSRTGEILPQLEDKNNHFIDALRYATEKIVLSGMINMPTSYSYDIGAML